ncbi:MAG: endonuclease/exonuclease/phosphatase family protein [Thermoleophilaceae bacterium]
MVVRALSWNLFHGRDHPPDPALSTWRSRLLRVTETDDTHAQVNRPLLDEFAQAIAAQEWQVALLQEAPPRWLRPLARAAGGGAACALTSRNFAPSLRAALARLNPDLIASNEGGSNQLLVRPPWRIADVLRLTLTRRPERRAMLYATLEGPGGRRLAVANLHASAGLPEAAEREVLAAAETALDLAGDVPLLFGGDLNLRPDRSPHAFEQLAQRCGFDVQADGKGIDHLLAHGLDVVEPAHALPPDAREVPGPRGRLLRLSDHPIVVASVGVP